MATYFVSKRPNSMESSGRLLEPDSPEGGRGTEAEGEGEGERMEESGRVKKLPVKLRNRFFQNGFFPKKMKFTLPFDDMEEIAKSVESYLQPSVEALFVGKYVEGSSFAAIQTAAENSSFIGGLVAGRRVLLSACARVNVPEAVQWAQEAIARRARATWNNGKSPLSEVQTLSTNADIVGTGGTETELLFHVRLSHGISTEPFLKEDVLQPLEQTEVLCGPEQFFYTFLADDSVFWRRYREGRGDTEIEISPWRPSDHPGELLRKLTYRTLCQSPMCPPSTAMTELQRCFSGSNNEVLVLETIQQAHDVPFGSAFEVHAQWTVTLGLPDVSNVNVLMGVHFKKACLVKGAISSGAFAMYKEDVQLIMRLVNGELETRNGTKKLPGSFLEGVEERRDDVSKVTFSEGGSPKNGRNWKVPNCVFNPFPREFSEKWKHFHEKESRPQHAEQIRV